MLARRFAVPLAVLFASLANCSDDAGPTSTPDSGGQPDAQSDAPAEAEGHSDAPVEAAQSDAPAEAADGQSDAPVEVSDAPIDSPSDAGDGALVCAIGSVVAYNQAGCGASAPAPYCQGPTDACALPFCDCDGTTHIGGCGFALRPFAYTGACVDGGPDGGDGGHD